MKHRFVIEYRTSDGDRRRVVYHSDPRGLTWLRSEYVRAGEQWHHRGTDRIDPPTVSVRPTGHASFAGP